MAVLGDDSDRSERRGRAQDRADIVRIGDLVEHQQNGALAAPRQEFVEPDVLERLDLDHHALVRRVVRHQPAEVGRSASVTGTSFGKLHEARASRVAQARSTLRSGLSSAAATACLPHKRGRLAVPWLWCDFLRRDMRAPMRERRAPRKSAAAVAALGVVAFAGMLRQVPTARMRKIG